MQAVSAAEREGQAADVRLAQLEANIAAAQVWHSLGKWPLSDCCTHLCGWFECYWLDTGWTSECMLVVYTSQQAGHRSWATAPKRTCRWLLPCRRVRLLRRASSARRCRLRRRA